jgi:hypothetical protein
MRHHVRPLLSRRGRARALAWVMGWQGYAYARSAGDGRCKVTSDLPLSTQEMAHACLTVKPLHRPRPVHGAPPLLLHCRGSLTLHCCRRLDTPCLDCSSVRCTPCCRLAGTDRRRTRAGRPPAALRPGDSIGSAANARTRTGRDSRELRQRRLLSSSSRAERRVACLQPRGSTLCGHRGAALAAPDPPPPNGTT